jgi:hypothetical protein
VDPVDRIRIRSGSATHRLNMEVISKVYLGSMSRNVHICTYWLRPPQLPLFPPHLDGQFVTPLSVAQSDAKIDRENRLKQDTGACAKIGDSSAAIIGNNLRIIKSYIISFQIKRCLFNKIL